MKRNHLFIAALTVIGAISCQKESAEQIGQTPVEPEYAKIQATFSSVNDDNTKTFLNAEDGAIIWEEGEAIAIFDGIDPSANEFQMIEGTRENPVFEGELTPGYQNLYAVYPYSSAVSCVDGLVTATIPTEQQIGAENVAQGALLTVGAVDLESTTIQFRNVFALLKVTVSLNDVKSIVVSGTDIAGEVSVNPLTGDSETVNGEDEIIVTPREGDNYFTKDESYYIAVNPITYASGDLKVGMVRGANTDAGEIRYTRVSTKEVTLARNSGYNFVVANSTLTWERHISTVEQFVGWDKLESGFNAYPVYLDADIDMSGKEWSPRGLGTTFDGQNHKVYNIVRKQATNNGLFANFTSGAVVRNLVLGSQDGETYDGVSCFTISQTTASSSFTYAGGIVGYISAVSTIENCKNFAKVQIDADNVTKIRLGGIAGGAGNFAASIIGCENAGEMYAPATTTALSANSNVGGIIGWSDGAITIKDTKNSGYIHTSNKLINRLCGILGGTSKAVQLLNCDNSGIVKYETANNTEVFISGIVGDLNNADAVITNCDNTGAVTIEDKTAKSSAVVEIAGVCSKLVLAKEFSNNTNAAEITNIVINSVNTEASGIIAGGVIANLAPASGNSVTISGCKTLNASNVVDNFSFNSTVDPKNTTKYIKLGGIAAQVTGTVTFDNCSNAGLVQKIATDFGYAYLGGIIGFINTGSNVTVTSCKNTRWVGTTKSALGLKDITVEKNGMVFMGGICGSMKGEASFTSCNNSGGVGQSGNVDGMYASFIYVGGIVGNAVNTVTVNDCKNSGEIKNLGKVLSWAADGNKWTNTSNGLRIGGIIGALNAATAGAGKTGTITGCTNTGMVTNESTLAKATQELGGILGYCSGGSAVINDCISNATIKSLNATTANIYSGAITGWVNNGAVTANNNGVAGKIIKTGGAETVITADNFASCLWTLAAGKTVTTTTPNYFKQ